jgi:hypothetical protein
MRLPSRRKDKDKDTDNDNVTFRVMLRSGLHVGYDQC